MFRVSKKKKIVGQIRNVYKYLHLTAAFLQLVGWFSVTDMIDIQNVKLKFFTLWARPPKNSMQWNRMEQNYSVTSIWIFLCLEETFFSEGGGGQLQLSNFTQARSLALFTMINIFLFSFFFNWVKFLPHTCSVYVV